MNLIIAGSRTFSDFALLKKEVHNFLQSLDFLGLPTIICGMARGADLLGRKLAIEYSWEFIEMPANWNEFGKSAGYKRNEAMAQIADACIVFWDGQSRGSAHMISLAKQYDLKLKVVYV